VNIHCKQCGVYLHTRTAGVIYGDEPPELCGFCEQPPVPAPTQPMPPEDEVFELAVANGFGDSEPASLYGSARDGKVSIGEYGCGDEVLRFAHAVLAKWGGK
jgi:hypothetical protein